jgi:hypothetical protein
MSNHRSSWNVPGRAKLGRRALLRGLAGAAIGLPLLEAMEERHARAGGSPQRFVVFFTPDGSYPDPSSGVKEPWGTGTANSLTFGTITQPLAPYVNNIVLMKGIDNKAAMDPSGPGDDHQRGMGTMLTGIKLQPGSSQGGCTTCAAAGWAGGPSIDQVIAHTVQTVGTTTKLASMEFGVGSGMSSGQVDDWGCMVYSSAGNPKPSTDDPTQAYSTLFANLNADPDGQKLLIAQRHAVLGAVMADAQKLHGVVSAADWMKIDQHISSINDINKSLDTVVAVGGQCQQPTAFAAYPNPQDGSVFQAIGALQMKMLVMTLTCDIARVASLQWTRSVGMAVMDWLTWPSSLTPTGQHTLSHAANTDTDSQNMLVAINNWYATQLASLISQMQAIDEGGGTLFDNTVILWCNELAVGNVHSHNDMRYLLAGSCGGKITGNRLLTFDGDPHNNLLVSLANVMGVNLTTFGDPQYCTGPLTGLL